MVIQCRGEACLDAPNFIRRNWRGKRLPLEGKLSQRQLRLMRSKLKIIAMSRYKLATFDLIRSGLSRTTFPSRGRLFSETFTPYFLGKDTPPVTGKPVPAPSKRGPSALS